MIINNLDQLLKDYYLAYQEYKKAKKERIDIKNKNPQCLNFIPDTNNERGVDACWMGEQPEDWCEVCKINQPYYEAKIKAGKKLSNIKRKLLFIGRKLNESRN